MTQIVSNQQALTRSRYHALVRRWAAEWIDGLIVLALSNAVSNVLGSQSINWSLIVYWLYFVVQNTLYGRTFGKRLFGLFVLDVSETHIPSAVQACRREVITLLIVGLTPMIYLALTDFESSNLPEVIQQVEKYIQTALALWLSADSLAALFSAKRRTLHDYLAGTVVVKT